VLEPVAGSSTDNPDARVFGMRCPNETGVSRDLIPARARSDKGRSLERRKTATQVGAHVGFGSRRAWKVGVGIERWPFVVDRRLDADVVDIRGPIARALVVTPCRNAAGSPSRSTVDKQQLLLGDFQ
jgi:hypothetical protein